MYLIRSLILLLISFLIISCVNNNIEDKKNKYSLAYIGGEYDGLILQNYLTNHLKSLNKFDNNSNFKIHAEINHFNKVYITNADNTSSREKISSNLMIYIYNMDKKCTTFQNNYAASQFYIFASNNHFISNQKASKKIKENNTENLVKRFINQLNKITLTCEK